MKLQRFSVLPDLPDLTIFSVGKILCKISLSRTCYKSLAHTSFISILLTNRTWRLGLKKIKDDCFLFLLSAGLSVGWVYAQIQSIAHCIGFNPYSKIKLARVGQLFFMFYLKEKKFHSFSFLNGKFNIVSNLHQQNKQPLGF